MPVWLVGALGTAGAIAVKMAMQLLTEQYMKRMTVAALRAVAKRTQNTDDDEAAEATAEAWNVK
jgi:hypothetical protein